MSGRPRRGQQGLFPGPIPPGLGGDFLNPALIEKMTREVPPDPVTGQIELAGISRFFMENINQDPDIQRLILGVMSTLEQHDRIDMSNYDFGSLTPEKDTLLHFTLEDMGRYHPINKRFNLTCLGSLGEPRHMDDFHEMPEPEAVLKFVRDAIPNRLPPIKTALPEVMTFVLEYAPYTSILRPFLDSLPRPFRWTIETPEIQAVRNAAEELHDEFHGAKRLDLAERCRSAGNFAYSKVNRAGAIDAFTRAIEHATSALEEVGDPAQQVTARRMLAVCLANRAGVHLVDGPGINATEALSDAEKAELADPTYVKAYHRQTRAHEHLGEAGKAREVMRRAKQKPGLEGEQSLREQLRRLEVL